MFVTKPQIKSTSFLFTRLFETTSSLSASSSSCYNVSSPHIQPPHPLLSISCLAKCFLYSIFPPARTVELISPRTWNQKVEGSIPSQAPGTLIVNKFASELRVCSLDYGDMVPPFSRPSRKVTKTVFWSEKPIPLHPQRRAPHRRSPLLRRAADRRLQLRGVPRRQLFKSCSFAPQQMLRIPNSPNKTAQEYHKIGQ